MTRPRKELISVSDTPYYHIVSRCVRRTYLCGVDTYSNRNYEHRRQWIVDRLRLLSSVFAIDICSYAIMSNHYHLVLKVQPHVVDDWSDDDVMERWTCLYKGPLLTQRLQAGSALSAAERQTASDIISVWRERLKEISWFMKCLNEPIAREANKEDGCTGHFWESRYKSQALLTEEALLSCMAYVDLNPVRAAMAETPEESDYTSIQERISPTVDLEQHIRNAQHTELQNTFKLPIKPLLHFDGSITKNEKTGIPFAWADYLELVDWTGRIVREDKRGSIPHSLPPILLRITENPQYWLQQSTQFEQHYRKAFQKRRSAIHTG